MGFGAGAWREGLLQSAGCDSSPRSVAVPLWWAWEGILALVCLAAHVGPALVL